MAGCGCGGSGSTPCIDSPDVVAAADATPDHMLGMTVPDASAAADVESDVAGGDGDSALATVADAPDPCVFGWTLCAGECVNLEIDTMNCGTCGNMCVHGIACTDGLCGVPCASGYTNCGGVCTVVSFDSNNCGGCGTACPAGQHCTNGFCG